MPFYKSHTAQHPIRSHSSPIVVFAEQVCLRFPQQVPGYHPVIVRYTHSLSVTESASN
jgi:hypothetical protein